MGKGLCCLCKQDVCLLFVFVVASVLFVVGFVVVVVAVLLVVGFVVFWGCGDVDIDNGDGDDGGEDGVDDGEW